MAEKQPHRQDRFPSKDKGQDLKIKIPLKQFLHHIYWGVDGAHGPFRIPSAKLMFGILLLAALLVTPNTGRADDHPLGHQISNSNTDAPSPAPVPQLSEIIPLSTKVSGRFRALENSAQEIGYATDIETQCSAIKERLDRLAGELDQLKKSKQYKYSKLAALKEAIAQENIIFQKVNEPLHIDIARLERQRQAWIAEKKRWSEWQSALIMEEMPESIKTVFSKTTFTISKALKLLLPRMEALLLIQEKSGQTQSKISTLTAELEEIMLVVRQDVLDQKSAPMLSKSYVSRFSDEIAEAIQSGIDKRLWTTNRFFSRQGWIVFIQVLIVIVVVFVIFRNQQTINSSKRFRFLAARPFSSGLFLGTLAAMVIYNYEVAPSVWLLFNTFVAGIAFTRLAVRLVAVAWKRQAVILFVAVDLITRMIEVLSFPHEFLRLYAVVAALICLVWCIRWYFVISRLESSKIYTWLLRLSSLFFIAIIAAELLGGEGFGLYLFVSMIRAIGIALAFMLFMYIVHGVIDWLAHRLSFRQTRQMDKDTEVLFHRVGYFIGTVFLALIWLPAILLSWGVYGNLKEAVTGFTSLNISLGGLRITVGMFITAACLVYGSVLASWIIRKLLMSGVFAKRGVERGVQHSITRLIHYFLIFIGFLFAISTLGFELSKLTILMSAFGIGIGFGLRSVVNNFVSGLILLFEQPVRMGDFIEIGGDWAEIKKIGLRATIVQTVEEADMIIPNADLVDSQVINWTLANRRVRLTIGVGVAYGSDIALVMETLKACAQANPNIARYPAPQILFVRFGESSLDFEARVWVLDADKRLEAKSELHQDIDQKFREANIEIAFPQRDVHLRSVDDPVIVQLPESG